MRGGLRSDGRPGDDPQSGRREHEFPTEFYDTLASGGWLGITTPEAYGGHGFGMHPVIVHGSDELKRRTLPRIVNGDLHVCFGVTEPGAGLDTTRITTFANGYSEEYHVARYFREARLLKIAPLSQEMVLNYLGSHVLGLPRSY